MEKLVEPYLIDVPRIYDPRGCLSFAQNGDSVMPFDIARVYWIYDVPAGEERGSHSHRTGETVLFATSGCFTVNLFNGRKWYHFTLNRPFQGLYVPPGYWRTLDNFASGSVCMVLASTPYSEEDYVRDFDEFMALKNCK